MAQQPRPRMSRSSALSESGEYWGEQDDGWCRAALTTEQSASLQSTQQETSRKRQETRRRQKPFFFAGASHSLQSSQSHSHDEGGILALHNLRLKMKTPLEIVKPSAAGNSSRLEPGESLDGSGATEESFDACFGDISWTKTNEEVSSRSFGRAKYACFKDDTDVSDVFRLLKECWKLRAPSVLISVTGSAQELNLEPKLTKDFEKGLAEAADCTDGWVITGGTDTGVMALVGRALRKRQLAATVGDAG